MKILYIHIGISKTGSSALQSYLHKNTEILQKNNIKYVKSGRINNKDIANTYFAFTMLDKFPSWVSVNKNSDYRILIDDIADEIKTSKESTFICSSEALSSVKDTVKLKYLKESLAGICKIVIVVYLRRPSLWLNSWYNQALKNHPFLKMTFDDFYKTAIYEFFKTIELYSSVFGKDIMIRNYDNFKKTNSDIVIDFFTILGKSNILEDYQQIINTDANITQSEEETRIFLEFNRLIDIKDRDRVGFNKDLRTLLSKYTFLVNDLDEIRMKPWQAQEFDNKYKQNIHWIEKNWKIVNLSQDWGIERNAECLLDNN